MKKRRPVSKASLGESKVINYSKVSLWAITARRQGMPLAHAHWLKVLKEGREPWWAPDR